MIETPECPACGGSDTEVIGDEHGIYTKCADCTEVYLITDELSPRPWRAVENDILDANNKTVTTVLSNRSGDARLIAHVVNQHAYASGKKPELPEMHYHDDESPEGCWCEDQDPFRAYGYMILDSIEAEMTDDDVVERLEAAATYIRARKV